jgi:acetyl esterase/lipase
MYVPSLTEAGYTVFAITHRATPTFRYPAQLEDAQRAARFVRANATKYGINPTRIGGAGGSSGAHLVSMLGTMGAPGDASDPDPVNRESARLQVIVARAAPLDLLQMTPSTGTAALALLLGLAGGGDHAEDLCGVQGGLECLADQLRVRRLVAVSPHPRRCGQDGPFHQSEMMEAALKKAGVPVKLVTVTGGDHGPTFPGAINPPDYKGEMVKWFDLYLRK